MIFVLGCGSDLSSRSFFEDVLDLEDVVIHDVVVFEDVVDVVVDAVGMDGSDSGLFVDDILFFLKDVFFSLPDAVFEKDGVEQFVETSSFCVELAFGSFCDLDNDFCIVDVCGSDGSCVFSELKICSEE